MQTSILLPRLHGLQQNICKKKAVLKCRTVRCSQSDEVVVEKPRRWGRFLSTLFLAGSISGPLLDSIHSRTYLQIYDSLPINITTYGLDFHSCLWVSPLLGVFYAVLGTLHCLGEDEEKVPSWGRVGLSFGLLAIGLELSAYLYENGVPYSQIHLTLMVFTLINWFIFDRTKLGLFLGAFCAIGAPIGELPILVWLKWWHYSRPDLFNLLPSWVIWCYFFYTPSVGNLARKLRNEVDKEFTPQS